MREIILLGAMELFHLLQMINSNGMARKIKIDNALIKRQRRKEANRTVVKKISCRILIICEGEKTEPNYFRSFEKINNESFTYEVSAEGVGSNTIAVVDEAIRQKQQAESTSMPYDSVWAVFDKDSFSKQRFNAAIIKANDNGINVAWSNEAFELWYLYHFYNRITAMHRSGYQKAISDAVNSSDNLSRKNKYKYVKNASNNYEIMKEYGNQENAINWAREQHQTYTDEKYADHNPCTTVYLLVLQLLNRDKELIDKVMKKINQE